MPQPPAAALDAILAATSVLSHRVEIYEADGVTKWNAGEDDDRLIEGSVSIDYSRDERRSLELRLDNSDFGLEHTPTKFWYDKILKPYYGCKYVESVAIGSQSARTNYATNPNFRTSSGTENVRDNTCRNPKVATNSTDWSFSTNSVGTVTTTRETSGGPAGVSATFMRATWATVSTGTPNSTGWSVGSVSADAITVTAGEYRTFSGYARSSVSGRTCQLFVRYYDSSNNLVTGGPSSSSAVIYNAWTRFSATGLVPANAVRAVCNFYCQAGGANWAVNDTIDTTAVLSEGVNWLDTYFDGDSTLNGTQISEGYTVAWEGTANASRSYVRLPGLLAVGSMSAYNSSPFASRGGRVFDGTNYLLRINTRWNPTGSSLLVYGYNGIMAAAPNDVGSLSFDVRQVGGSGAVSILSRLGSYTSGGSNIGVGTPVTTSVPVSTSWTTVIVPNYTAPATTATLRPLIYSGSSGIAANVTLEFRNVILEKNNTTGRTGFFDGSTADFGNRTYDWSGTPDASSSTEIVTVTTYLNQLTTWETQLGEFMIDRISEAHFPYSVSVTARDYTKKLLLSKFAVTTAFASGTAIEVAIKAIAQNGGITKFLIPNTSHNLGKDYYFERGVSRWEAIKQITDAFGYEIFFDAQGYLVMREYQDPVTAPFATLLATGPTIGNLITYEKSLNDSRIYNKIVVTGESTDADVPPVYAIATNTEPSSPTRIAAIGERLYQYTSSFITTVLQAQDVADKFLKLHALEEFDLNFEAIAYPWLDVGEIVQFADPRPSAGQPDRFLLSSLTVPLGLGGMSGNAKRVTVVG